LLRAGAAAAPVEEPTEWADVPGAFGSASRMASIEIFGSVKKALVMDAGAGFSTCGTTGFDGTATDAGDMSTGAIDTGAKGPEGVVGVSIARGGAGAGVLTGEITGGTGICAMGGKLDATGILVVGVLWAAEAIGAPGCENATGRGGGTDGAACEAGDGLGCGAGGGTVAKALADFDSGPSLRVIPIPVRSVFRTCSRDTGFVRTRLAPRRNAFGTPALPSTMAMAMAALLSADARALLKTWVAVCALSQSTMSRSKRCVPSRFNVKGASLECSKLTSSSSRIWVMA